MPRRLAEVEEGDERQGSRAVLGLKGVRAPLFFHFQGRVSLLQCAEPVSLHPHLTSPSLPTALGTWQTQKDASLNMQKDRDTCGGQDGSEEAPGRQERPWGNGLLSLALGGMGTANGPGSPTPNPSGGWWSPTMLGLETPRWLEFWPLCKPQSCCFHRSY